MMHEASRGFLSISSRVRGSCSRKCESLDLGGNFWAYLLLLIKMINSVETRCIVKAMNLQGVLVKIGDFIKFKGFLVEFLENRHS